MDTDAGHNWRGVLQAEGGQVQADVTSRERETESHELPSLNFSTHNRPLNRRCTRDGRGGEVPAIPPPVQPYCYGRLYPAPPICLFLPCSAEDNLGPGNSVNSTVCGSRRSSEARCCPAPALLRGRKRTAGFTHQPPPLLWALLNLRRNSDTSKCNSWDGIQGANWPSSAFKEGSGLSQTIFSKSTEALAVNSTIGWSDSGAPKRLPIKHFH